MTNRCSRQGSAVPFRHCAHLTNRVWRYVSGWQEATNAFFLSTLKSELMCATLYVGPSILYLTSSIAPYSMRMSRTPSSIVAPSFNKQGCAEYIPSFCFVNPTIQKEFHIDLKSAIRRLAIKELSRTCLSLSVFCRSGYGKDP